MFTTFLLAADLSPRAEPSAHLSWSSYMNGGLNCGQLN